MVPAPEDSNATELKGALNDLQSSDEKERDRLEAVIHELHVHQVELELQNQQLREAQSLLEDSRARYADLYDFAPVGYCTIDSCGILQQINLSGAAMLGMQRQRLVDRPFALAARADPGAFDALLKRCFNEPGPTHAELSLAPRGLAPMTLQVTCTRVDENGMKSVRMALVDITERRRAEDERAALLDRERVARSEAEAANRSKDEFLATVSHELRTPLGALLMWLSVARSTPASTPEHDRALDAVELSARAQLRLIQDLIEVSRLRNARMQLDFAPVEAAWTVEKAVELLRATAAAKRVSLELSVAERSLRALADPDRLRQIVGNLLANAIEFTPPGGTVRVRLSRHGVLARIEVIDDGEGIARDFLPFVFEPFRRGPRRQENGHGGLGLGLAIVAELTRLHGGTVRAHSEGEGKGSSFTVDLPLLPDEPGAAAPAHTPVRRVAQVGVLFGVRVLLVEDEQMTREAVTALLEGAGATVLAVASAQEALAALPEARADVLLSDIAMRGDDGITLLRRIRALPPGSGGDLPAAAMTAQPSEEGRLRVLAAGFSHCLVKPLEPAQLIALLGRLARRTATPAGG